MKKYIVLILILMMSLTSCSLFEPGNLNNNYNNDNLTIGSPIEGNDLISVDNNVSYYESTDISLSIEINGLYTVIRYFTIDEEHKNLRIYDNMYLYPGDYFYMLSNDYRNWYADLDENVSEEYAVKEIEEGEDYSIVIKKEGIYKIIFDLDTKKFNLEYKSEIDQPKYLKIKNCEILEFIDSKATYKKMEVNPNNPYELMIKNYNVVENRTIYFLSVTHVSKYKIFLNEENLNLTAKYANKNRQGIKMLISGTIDLYLNTLTYEVRIDVK